VYVTKRCETGGREGSCLKGPGLTIAMGWDWVLSIAIADGGLVRTRASCPVPDKCASAGCRYM
jgi:hypothetical protein